VGGVVVKSVASSTMTTTTSSVGICSNEGDPVAALEQRQLHIIDKLSNLKNMITSIHENCVASGAVLSTASSRSKVASGVNSVQGLPIETDFFDEIIVSFGIRWNFGI
jgi:hypothetical protein